MLMLGTLAAVKTTYVRDLQATASVTRLAIRSMTAVRTLMKHVASPIVVSWHLAKIDVSTQQNCISWYIPD